MNYSIETNKEDGLQVISQFSGHKMEIWEARQICAYLNKYIEENIDDELEITQQNIESWQDFMESMGGSGGGRYKKSLNIKKYVNKLKEWDGKCEYCRDSVDSKDISLDHIIPESQGGTDNEDNINFCCKWCNMSKGTKSIEKFLAYIAPYRTGSVQNKKDLHQYYKFKKLEEKYGKK